MDRHHVFLRLVSCEASFVFHFVDFAFWTRFIQKCSFNLQVVYISQDELSFPFGSSFRLGRTFSFTPSISSIVTVLRGVGIAVPSFSVIHFFIEPIIVDVFHLSLFDYSLFDDWSLCRVRDGTDGSAGGLYTFGAEPFAVWDRAERRVQAT